MTEQEYYDLEALTKTPGWKMVSEFVARQIAGLLSDLERTSFRDLAEVAHIQGKLQAYRAVLDYPGTRLREYEKRQKEA